MAVLLFWNLGGRQDAVALRDLCRAHDVDVRLLAEAAAPSIEFMTTLNGPPGTPRPLWELPHLESRIRAFTRYPPQCISPAFDDSHVKMLHLRPPIGLPLLIVAAHLPSKLWAEDEDQQYRVRQLRSDIVTQETKFGHQNTVIIGDLNANPFEAALTAADGLHGVMDRRVALRRPPRIRGQNWDYFYNPMWSRLGDGSPGPSGTYWRAGTSLINYYWNTFDQVLLRPALLPFYDPAGLIVPEEAGVRRILDDGTGIGLSDHLPVAITLAIEKEMDSG
jgi:hypothetical protein